MSETNSRSLTAWNDFVFAPCDLISLRGIPHCVRKVFTPDEVFEYFCYEGKNKRLGKHMKFVIQ